MTDRLTELYQERAEYAEAESDLQDVKKYTRVGGFWWRLFDTLERWAVWARKETQKEIDRGTRHD